MSKLAWVLTPLLLAAALVLALTLAGRRPSRRALNAGSSLLLLAYVAGTAGLGIFWVANQQLPVFDWHYLFGYATVLLLVLHLGFNLPAVWRWLHRPRSAAPAAPRAPGRRRPVLALLGGALGLGAAFWLGLRHGRTEIHVAAPAPGAGLDLVERFHAHTGHSREGVLRQTPGTDWGDPPPPFKPAPPGPRLALPRDRGTGALLWHTAGVRERRGGIAYRTAPSSGALFATELYLVAYRLPDVPPGLWWHDARADALVQLAEAPPAPAALGLDDAPAALVVATAVFRRSGHKYRDRAYRYVLADLGHALENLRAVAQAEGHALRLLPAFDGAGIAQRLGVDEAEEGVLALAALDGRPAAAAAPVPGWVPPPASATLRLGVTEAMHRASALQPAASSVSTPDAGPALPLPRVPAVTADPRALIARRRSQRRFAREPLAPDQVAALLQAMGTPAPLLSAALRVDLLTPAVQGLPPRAWRWDAVGHRLRPRTAPDPGLRARARAAALDQDVVGDAALVFVLSADRATIAADPLGAARGYRHALLETGLAGERLYLQATALGLAVCGVGAFYDDEAARLVGLDRTREWVLHFVAVGRPA